MTTRRRRVHLTATTRRGRRLSATVEPNGLVVIREYRRRLTVETTLGNILGRAWLDGMLVAAAHRRAERVGTRKARGRGAR